MSYPGDQQQPGGWGPFPPPQSPSGPVEDQAGHGGPPYGGGPHEKPYGGHNEGFDGGPGGPASPFGNDQPGPYGGVEQGPSFGAEAPTAYGEGPGAHPPGVDPGDGLRSGPDRKRLIIGAAIAAGVVVVGGGTAFALTSGGGGDKPKPKPAAVSTSAAPPSSPPASPTPTATETGRGERLRSRTTDPVPLTLNEIFKAQTFKVAGRRYYLTGRRAEHKCSAPTHGVKFYKALVNGGCTQVLRATFSDGTLIGTIGVINLRSQAASEAAQVASRQKDAFIVALPGGGTTKKIGQGLSLTTAEVDGHYLIMSWVQYPNGKPIAKKDYPAVTTFVRSTTYGSNLRTALNYRSMEGKPS